MTGATFAEPVAQPHRAESPRRRRAARRTLGLLLLVGVLPVVASYLAFYVWQPAGRVNYGELLAPVALPAEALPGGAGQPALGRRELEGRWTLLFVGAAACDEPCIRSLYAMRQSRLAQGEDMERVARLWLVPDRAAPSPPILAMHEGLRVAHATPAWLAQLPAAAAGRHIYLIDPLGNAIMRFPPDADPGRMLKDLRRLLKYSQLGRTAGAS